MLKTPLADATHYWEDEQTETDSIDWCMAYNLPSEWQSAYTFSAARWNASPSDWTLVLDSCNVFTGRMSFSQQGLADDPGATYTVRSGGLVLGGWSALNTDYDWDIYPWEGYDMCDPDCDIITVMVHEMGHRVRFIHGGCNASVMCAQFTT